MEKDDKYMKLKKTLILLMLNSFIFTIFATDLR